MKTTKVLLLSATLLSLTACGGGSDGGSSGSGSSVVSDAEIKAFVLDTNKAQYSQVYVGDYREGDPEFDPDSYISSDYSMLRFGVNTQIPIYFVSADGGNPPQDIIDGIAKIEAILGDIYTDFTLVTADLSVYKDANYPDENRPILVDGFDRQFDLTEFNTRFGTSIDYGIVYAQDTGFYSSEYSSSPQNMCANASIGPYESSWYVNYSVATGEFRPDTVLWVNMGNGQCDWSADMVAHETAHNMGMLNHISNHFGLWTNTAKDILATIYNNPAGTLFEDIQVFRNDDAVVY